MDHHVDIDLRPDPELAAHQLMSALYAKLHRALVRLNCNDIGVSFPGHNDEAPHLGNRLRLHGSQEALAALMGNDWLTGMRDHVLVGLPSRVPGAAAHCAVRRVQAKSSPERLRRRQMRRHGISAEEAQQRVPDGAAKTLRLPFVQLGSSSTGQSFRLFIAHVPVQEPAVGGVFGAYGLSQTATVPWF